MILSTKAAQEKINVVTAAEGAPGPALKNGSAKKNLGDLAAFFKAPQPPMPALFPGSLDNRDVETVAGFVHDLH